MKGRKVLLINPWIHDFAAYDMWAKPLGLLSIGSVLRKNGCDVTYIDCLQRPHPMIQARTPNINAWGHGKYYRKIIEKPSGLADIKRNYSRYGISIAALRHDLSAIDTPDIILVSSLMTYWYPGVVETIRIVKEIFPNVPLVLGGIYATLCTDHAEKTMPADYIIAGQGEVKILDLLSRLWDVSPCFIPDMNDLDSLPYPCFDLIDGLRYVCIQATRGCPYRCTYCASHVLNKGVIRRDPVNVSLEIAYWNRAYKVKDFAFYDDALLYKPEEFAEVLLREIIRKVPGLRFHCPNGLHARSISKGLAILMKESGFKTIRLGFETADPIKQVTSGGKISNAEYLNAVEHLHNAGFSDKEIGVYIMCGLPGQRADEVVDAIDLVKGSGATPRITEYSPIPQTKDWQDALRSSAYPLKDDPLFHNNTILPCRWEGLTYEMYQDIKTYARSRGG